VERVQQTMRNRYHRRLIHLLLTTLEHDTAWQVQAAAIRAIDPVLYQVMCPGNPEGVRQRNSGLSRVCDAP
jgi:hypothetical protein